VTVVDWRTWEAKSLPPDMLGLVRAGELWGRLRGDDHDRWIDLAATPDGPPIASSPRWQRERVWGPYWNDETGLLSANGSESDRLWLEPSGKGGILTSDERLKGRWRIVRSETGLPEFEVLPQRERRTCPDGSLAAWGGIVMICEEPRGPALYWDEDDDRATPARLLPALPPEIVVGPVPRLLPIGPDRFALYSALGPPTVLTLNGGGGWREPVALEVPSTLMIRPLGTDMLVVETNVGPRVSDVLQVCSATTGRCSAPPKR
jgi:hypothetical protein